MKTRILTAIFSAGFLLGGCGSDEAAPEATTSKPSSSQSTDPVARMAKAVSADKAGAGVDLKYEIQAKPAVGVPFEIEIALVATADAETMAVAIGGMPGITVTNAAVPPLTEIKAGQVNSHKFTVLADQIGVYYVSVAVTTQLAGTTQARTFSIPLLLGEVQVSQKATVEPPKDATGQAVESMPATETGR